MLRLFAIAFGPMGRAVGKAMALACTGSCTAPVLGPVLVLGACTGAVLALVHFKHAVLYWLYWHPLSLHVALLDGLGLVISLNPQVSVCFDQVVHHL